VVDFKSKKNHSKLAHDDERSLKNPEGCGTTR
jgi:hypothetical protein